MADKELKDWCKTCSVEPPAMKFKCPECEHNPDKEQIMIDEVIVSDCKHFCLEAQIPEIPLAGSSNICCEENIAKECKDNPNCYFKQLARKTQECDTLKSQLDFEVKQKKCFQHECEELKEKLYQIEDVVKPINEQLPEDSVIRQIMLILNDCNKLEPSYYRKALEEIEQELKEDIYCESQECGCDDSEECLRCTKDLILDIISGFADGRSKASPDSECEVDDSAAKSTTATSVEQIQDNKAKGGEDEKI